MSLGVSSLGTLPLATQPTTTTSGSYTLTCATGTYSYVGNATVLSRSITLACATGTYVYTGNDATLVYAPTVRDYVLDCSTGSYIYTGQTATLSYLPEGKVLTYYIDITDENNTRLLMQIGTTNLLIQIN